LHYIDLIDQ